MLKEKELVEKFENVFDSRQAFVLAEAITDAYTDLVKTSDFNELKAIVKDLAEAQQRTELRVERLAVAQEKTEQRLDRLAAAQEKTEQRLDRLAAAQEKTEQRLDRLAAAQEKTEQRLDRLAAAQENTERALQDLIREHKETRRQLGGLSMTVGYRLEDEAFKALPNLLRRDYNLIIEGPLKRQYVTDNTGKHIEVNIFGQGRRNEKQVTILGEGKSQLSKHDVDDFLRKRLKRFAGVFEALFPVLVTYMISEPDVEEYARGQGIALYYSYDF